MKKGGPDGKERKKRRQDGKKGRRENKTVKGRREDKMVKRERGKDKTL
jgi:hypothetical protein